MTVDDTRAAFEAAYGREPTTVASAPGRVNLVGGHTDYTEGFVLPMAVDRRTNVAVAPREDGLFSIRSTAFTIDFGPDALPEKRLAADADTAWANYPIGVLHELREEELVPSDRGVDVLVDGDVPRGAGLSSSAALEVATAAAVVADSNPDELPRQTLADAAWRAETGFVGLNCGIMDQYASALCRANHALFLDCRSHETELVPFADTGVALVVVDTGVEHELASSAYNDRVSECREAAERLDERVGGIDTLRDVTREVFLEHAENLPGALRRRVRHVVTENERVHAAVEALRDGDMGTLGTQMTDSHASLRDDYEVSCEELDSVVDIAWRTEGVLGARMTGGGFGGSVIALVETDHIDEFRNRVGQEYIETAPRGADPRVFVCQSADGVRVER